MDLLENIYVLVLKWEIVVANSIYIYKSYPGILSTDQKIRVIKCDCVSFNRKHVLTYLKIIWIVLIIERIYFDKIIIAKWHHNTIFINPKNFTYSSIMLAQYHTIGSIFHIDDTDMPCS